MDMSNMQYTNNGGAPMSDKSPTPNGGMSTDFTFTTESLTGCCKSDATDKMKTTDSDHRV